MKCQFTKLDGKNCEANAMVGVVYCFSHNPQTKQDKKSAVLKGGLSPKPRKAAKLLEPVSIKSVVDILMLIEDTINRVRSEPVTHQQANSVGYLANIALKVLEVEQFEERLVVLETEIKKKHY